MKKIKLVFDREKEKILYPKKQSNIYLKNSIKTLNNKTFSKIKELGEAIINIQNKTIEFTEEFNILYNNIDNVKVNIDNFMIGCFKSADLASGSIKVWEEVKGITILPIGYYYVELRDPIKKGILTILEEKSSNNSTDNLLEPMSLIKYNKSVINSFINNRFYLYDDKYINISYSSYLFAFCIIKDQLSLGFRSMNSKAMFKEFFNSPEDCLVALVPILYNSYDDNKNKKFTIDDIKNW